jgi:hypothetical protein
LKTKAEKSSLTTGTSPSLECLGSGGVVCAKNLFKKLSTPKLFIADPKNMGVSFPFLTF